MLLTCRPYYFSLWEEKLYAILFLYEVQTVVVDTIYQHVYIVGLNCLLEDYYTGAMIYLTRSRNKVFILIWYM